MLAVVCAASATIALLSRSTAAELQHMLHLGFVVTTAHIVGLIVVGVVTPSEKVTAGSALSAKDRRILEEPVRRDVDRRLAPRALGVDGQGAEG